MDAQPGSGNAIRDQLANFLSLVTTQVDSLEAQNRALIAERDRLGRELAQKQDEARDAAQKASEAQAILDAAIAESDKRREQGTRYADLIKAQAQQMAASLRELAAKIELDAQQQAVDLETSLRTGTAEPSKVAQPFVDPVAAPVAAVDDASPADEPLDELADEEESVPVVAEAPAGEVALEEGAVFVVDDGRITTEIEAIPDEPREVAEAAAFDAGAPVDAPIMDAPAPVDEREEPVGLVEAADTPDEAPLITPEATISTPVVEAVDALPSQPASEIEADQTEVVDAPTAPFEEEIAPETVFEAAAEADVEEEPVAPIAEAPVAPIAEAPVAPIAEAPVAPPVQEPVAPPIAEAPRAPIIESNIAPRPPVIFPALGQSQERRPEPTLPPVVPPVSAWKPEVVSRAEPVAEEAEPETGDHRSGWQGAVIPGHREADPVVEETAFTEAATYDIVARPFTNFSSLVTFQKAIREISGVGDVRVRVFQNNALSMSLVYAGPDRVADALRRVNGFDVTDIQVDENRVEMTVVSSASKASA